MQYMFLIYSQERPEGPLPESVDTIRNRHWSVMEDAQSQGKLVAVEGLQPTHTATTIREKDGQSLVIDGPFAETKEQLAGYYIIDCKDLDEAIEWGKRIPSSCKGLGGCIEIRPVAQLPKRP